MSRQYTHVIEIFPEKSERVVVGPNKAEDRVSPTRYVLSRWADGLVIGMAQGATLNIIDFDKQNNVGTMYRDDKFALAALRRHADQDAGGAGAVIEEIDMSLRAKLNIV